MTERHVQPRLQRWGPAERPRMLVPAACASWLAASIHLILIRPHFRWWLPAGAFFTAMTMVEMVMFVALLRPTRTRTLTAAVISNVVVIRCTS